MSSDTERGLWVEGVSDGGAPMHAEANGWYWYSDNDGQGTGARYNVPEAWRDLAPWQRAARYLRVTDDEIMAAEEKHAEGGHGRPMTREQFRAFVDSLRPRWAVEGPVIHAANVAREQAEERTERERDAAIARGVTITSEYRDPTPEEARQTERDPAATYWTVRLGYKGRTMTTPFHMGSAHDGEPEAADVLSSLLSDAEGLANAPTFADWCAEYGYDEDSRAAERTHRAVKALSEKVRRLLGSEYAARAALAAQR